MPPEPKPGRVRLVGAGPGAADLLTVRALRAVEGAQALLYDALTRDRTLFKSAAEIGLGRRAAQPVLGAWSRDGRRWRPIGP